MTDAAMGPVTVGLGTPPAIATAASGRTKNGMSWSQMGTRNGFVMSSLLEVEVAPNRAPRERTSQGEPLPGVLLHSVLKDRIELVRADIDDRLGAAVDNSHWPRRRLALFNNPVPGIRRNNIVDNER